MNTKLVDSLVQIINSLTEEEKELLEQKLEHKHRKSKPLDIPVEDIIHEMREERTEQIMRASFPQMYSSQDS